MKSKKADIKPQLTDFQMYLFNKGENYESYNMLGAKRMTVDGNNGYLFSVWAPNAKSVSAVGDFNEWNRTKGVMHKHTNTGIWEAFIKDAKPGQNYKFSIEPEAGEIFLKADPYAYYSELRPKSASITADLSYKWKDAKWINKRNKTAPYDKPVNIYELHFGSWKQHEDGTHLTYSEMADELIPYIKEMGYTHIELMPICEYPFDGSWGYQVVGYYSINSRYGTPAEFKELVDKCHRADIGVIMDWVPAHFPKDANGLAKFDGECLYEYADTRLGEHKEWGTLVFNWGKAEVKSFLISNAMFYLDEYHLDGLRVDAVSSMLYLDYNRPHGEWIPNKYGGKENLDAIEFLRQLNATVFEKFPSALMIAEESTSWGGVTKPVDTGGLGFNFKWNMGWMNDMLKYMSMDPYFRSFNHDMLTFSMMYAFSENYILALSHDEVVHGKRSLIDKMHGTYEQKFASLRALFGFMYAHPGKKLLFMGGEFGQFIEWRYYEGLDWQISDFEMHKKLAQFCKDLNSFYKSEKALYENDENWGGFEWINANDRQRSVISFIRKGKNKKDKIVSIINFTPVVYENYSIGVPDSGTYEIALSTDDKKYGGSGFVTKKKFKAKKAEIGGFDYYIELTLPPLSALYLKKTSDKADIKKAEVKTKAKTKAASNKETKSIAESKIVAKKPAANTKAKTNKKTIDKKVANG